MCVPFKNEGKKRMGGLGTTQLIINSPLDHGDFMK